MTPDGSTVFNLYPVMVVLGDARRSPRGRSHTPATPHEIQARRGKYHIASMGAVATRTVSLFLTSSLLLRKRGWVTGPAASYSATTLAGTS